MMLNRWMAVVLLLAALAGPAGATDYFVAPEGCDANKGTSRDQAWRTVNHAADRVRAGDRVVIGGGTYSESVRLRAMGEEGRPITFMAAAGEKVVFDGRSRSMPYAFYGAVKSHLRFDGLYFVQFSGLDNFDMPWSDQSPGNGDSGVIALYRCRDVQITRCFHDGRGPGYAPGLVLARECSDLLVRNCVTIASMSGGIQVYYSPDTRIENNVFVQCLIQATIVQNRPGQAATTAGNIFTDNIPAKVHIGLLYDSTNVVYQRNCFFVRVPAEQKGWSSDGTLAGWMARVNGAGDGSQAQVAVDPEFAGARGLSGLNRDGTPAFVGDLLIGKEELDFSDLFATREDLRSRGIGLQPEAFADFHFRQKQAQTK